MITMSPELTAKTVAQAAGKLLNTPVNYELRDAGDVLLFQIKPGGRIALEPMPPANSPTWFEFVILMVYGVAHYLPDQPVTFTRRCAETIR